MGKNKDLIQVLLLILVGMLVPFVGSVWLSYGFDVEKIGRTFLYFLVIFGLELLCVYLYFALSGKHATKKLEAYRPKEKT